MSQHAQDTRLYLTQLVDNVASASDPRPVLGSIASFLREFDPLVLGEQDVTKLRGLLDFISIHAEGTDILEVLYAAILRYPQNTMTPVHHFLVRQCCKLRSYDLAIPLLTQDIDHFPKSHFLTYHDHLLYYFYGGLCFAALRNYSRALFFLSITLAAGGTGTSRIQLEAYKKYILIGLIHMAKQPDLPRTMHNNCRRSLETLASTYLALADLYLARPLELQQFVTKYAQEFESDGNSGLVNSALASIASHKLLSLTKVYISLRLSDLSEKLSIPESEVTRNLTQMVTDGRILATIDDAGWVTFPDAEESPERRLQQLAGVYSTIGSLNLRMAKLQKSLELDPEYAARTERSGAGLDVKEKGKGKSVKQGLGKSLAFKMEDESDTTM